VDKKIFFKNIEQSETISMRRVFLRKTTKLLLYIWLFLEVLKA